MRFVMAKMTLPIPRNCWDISDILLLSKEWELNLNITLIETNASNKGQ